MISRDSAPIDEETDTQRITREARNADRVRWHREADAAAKARAAVAVATLGARVADQQDGNRVAYNLEDAFILVEVTRST